MAVIDLAFSPENGRRLLDGKKCSSARDEKKGEPGDVFEYEGVWFRLLDILCLHLLDIALNYYHCEGFEDRDACAAELHRLYPGKNWDDRLYVHFLARCPP